MSYIISAIIIIVGIYFFLTGIGKLNFKFKDGTQEKNKKILLRYFCYSGIILVVLGIIRVILSISY